MTAPRFRRSGNLASAILPLDSTPTGARAALKAAVTAEWPDARLVGQLTLKHVQSLGYDEVICAVDAATWRQWDDLPSDRLNVARPSSQAGIQSFRYGVPQ